MSFYSLFPSFQIFTFGHGVILLKISSVDKFTFDVLFQDGLHSTRIGKSNLFWFTFKNVTSDLITVFYVCFVGLFVCLESMFLKVS